MRPGTTTTAGAARARAPVAAARPPFASASSPSPSPPSASLGARRRPRVPPAAALATTAPPPAGAASAADYEAAQQRALVAAMGAVSPGDLQSLLSDLGVRYDPERLAASLAPRWPELYARSLTVAAALGGFAASLAADAALGRASDPAQQARRGAELVRLVSRLGPAFVKIAQALSARPDLLPRPYLEALAALQDRMAPFPDETAFALIEQELGRPASAVFSELSSTAVAAASLGQVYRGVHRATGREVAVKVQRPGIGEGIAVDMVLLRRLAAAADAQRFVAQPLVPLVDEFAARLFGELDYLQEGRNCERFLELYGKIPRVSAPEIFWGATSRRVLTMSWVDGVKLTDADAMAAKGLSVLDFVDVGVQCTLEQMLGAGERRIFVSFFFFVCFFGARSIRFVFFRPPPLPPPPPRPPHPPRPPPLPPPPPPPPPFCSGGFPPPPGDAPGQKWLRAAGKRDPPI